MALPDNFNSLDWHTSALLLNSVAFNDHWPMTPGHRQVGAAGVNPFGEFALSVGVAELLTRHRTPGRTPSPTC